MALSRNQRIKTANLTPPPGNLSTGVSEQHGVMGAINAATAAIAVLPQGERTEWLCYVAEAIEEDCGPLALETLRDSIAERYNDEGW